MYDVIVIGGGPAGVSASLYLKRANIDVALVYFGTSSIEDASLIENYYGFVGGISGEKLYKDGIEQAKKLGVEIVNKEVLKIENLGNSFKVKFIDKEIEAKAVVLATGNKKIKPSIENLDKFTGKGVSYCAICDAFFYKGKDVCVIGSGDYALSELDELKNVARSVTILTNGEEFNSSTSEEFNVIDKKINSIDGDEKVRSVTFSDGDKKEIDGIFIALGEANGLDFAKTLGILTDGDNIKVNENMETNIKGIYACGNITGGLKQISKAVYEGTVAGLSAINYIRNLKKEN